MLKRTVIIFATMLSAQSAWAASCVRPTLGDTVTAAMKSEDIYLIAKGNLTSIGPIEIEDQVFGQQWSAKNLMSFEGQMVGGWPADNVSFEVVKSQAMVKDISATYSDDVKTAMETPVQDKLFFFRKSFSGEWELSLGLCQGPVFEIPTEEEENALVNCLANGACGETEASLLARTE